MTRHRRHSVWDDLEPGRIVATAIGSLVGAFVVSRFFKGGVFVGAALGPVFAMLSNQLFGSRVDRRIKPRLTPDRPQAQGRPAGSAEAGPAHAVRRVDDATARDRGREQVDRLAEYRKTTPRRATAKRGGSPLAIAAVSGVAAFGIAVVVIVAFEILADRSVSNVGPSLVGKTKHILRTDTVPVTETSATTPGRTVFVPEPKTTTKTVPVPTERAGTTPKPTPAPVPVPTAPGPTATAPPSTTTPTAPSGQSGDGASSGSPGG